MSQRCCPRGLLIACGHSFSDVRNVFRAFECVRLLHSRRFQIVPRREAFGFHAVRRYGVQHAGALAGLREGMIAERLSGEKQEQRRKTDRERALFKTFHERRLHCSEKAGYHFACQYHDTPPGVLESLGLHVFTAKGGAAGPTPLEKEKTCRCAETAEQCECVC